MNMMHFSSSRPNHEKNGTIFWTHHQQQPKKSRMMMMDLIAGSFDILVRRVHKKREATEEGEQKVISDSKIPFSCGFLLSSHGFSKNLPAFNDHNFSANPLIRRTRFMFSPHELSKLSVHFLWHKQAESSFSCIFTTAFHR